MSDEPAVTLPSWPATDRVAADIERAREQVAELDARKAARLAALEAHHGTSRGSAMRR